jgi:hypothetical protein
MKPTPRRAPDGHHGPRAGRWPTLPSPGQSASSSTPVPQQCRAELTGQSHHHQHRYPALTPTDPHVTAWPLTVPSPVNLPPARRVLHLTQCPQQPQTAKDEPVQMTTIQRRLPVNDAGDPAGPACPDGRLLALRCLGIPQVATRAAMSRRRTLLRMLAAFCARIQPRNTAELASLVLHMGEEIDRRERMLDAALRAVVTVPGERIPGSPAASRPSARPEQPEQIWPGTDIGGLARLAPWRT